MFNGPSQREPGNPPSPPPSPPLPPQPSPPPPILTEAPATWEEVADQTADNLTAKVSCLNRGCYGSTNLVAKMNSVCKCYDCAKGVLKVMKELLICLQVSSRSCVNVFPCQKCRKYTWFWPALSVSLTSVCVGTGAGATTRSQCKLVTSDDLCVSFVRVLAGAGAPPSCQ